MILPHRNIRFLVYFAVAFVETTHASTSFWPWAPTYTTVTTTTTEATSLWWPPTLTTRPTVPHRPRPTTSASTTRKTTISTTSTTIAPSSEEPEDTTPHNADRCVSGKYYSDSTNCGAYFVCVYGKKKRHYCAIGLHWNAKTQTCDWPSKANCWEHLINEIQAVESTTSMASTPSHTRPVVGCVNGEYYAVPGDCAAFYTCDDGRLYKRRCPNGLSWNQQTKLCDWKQSTYCDETSTLQNAEMFKEKPSINNKPKVDKVKLEEGCSRGQFTSHAEDCNKYYQCLWGTYKEIRCSSGLFWNKELSICDWPDNVDCVNTDDNESDLPDTEYPSFIPPKPTSTEYDKPSTITSIASSSETTTKFPWWSWTESSTSSSSENTSKSTPWWTWTESSSFSSETPSTSWEWTPSTTTAATLPTTKPSYSLTGKYKVVCYFTNWAWYRPGSGKYLPEDTDTNLCTHIVYGFTVLDYERLTIRIHDSWADVDNRFFERVAALKKRGVKVTVAVGGWNDSAGDKYSRLVNSPTARANFISSVLRFINKYGFDGLDLDWEYPVCWQTNCNKGPESDKAAFSALITELRESFNKHGYLLSSAVSPSKVIIDKGYDVPLLSENLDWIAVMTYDFHGQWDKKTGHVAPIHYIPGDDYDYFNSYYAINYWIEKGANSRKIIMGMPMYGQGFTLANTSNHGLNAPAAGPSHAGEYTRSNGFLAYYEICQKIKKEQWTVVQDAQGRRGPYAYKGDQWVGFDDVYSIRMKVNLIKKLKLGGGMIWALDLDDFRNVCGDGHYPLLTTIARGLAQPGHDFDIDNSFVTGAEITWSTVSIPTIPGVIVNLTSTRTTSTKRPTKPTKGTTTKRTTITSSTPYVIQSTEKTTVSNEYTAVTEENNAASVEWSSSSTVTNYLPEQSKKFKIVCYFTNWAWYRQGNGKYMINDIDPNLCTHIIYAFAVLDPNKLIIKPHDSWADIDNQFYEKVVSLKKRNIKVLLAIGGWNDSAGNKYSRLVNSKQARDKFITHVIQFLKKYGFEGLDVDWEYPKCWQVNCKLGPSSDKKAFADFITELREMFDEHGLLLSAAVSANRKVIDEGYDVPLLSNKLDWLSVMVYDYHGQWDEVTGHVAPMYEHPDDVDRTFNANYSIHYWVKKGADPRKIVMGMPMYGQSFTLASSKNNTLNSRAYGGGEAGESTRARGFLAYYEICERILRRSWDVEFDIKGRMGPYAKRGTQWVSFDDQAMIKHKSQYAYYNNLGGAMIWALDLDDFRGVCGCGTYPLLKTINKVLRNYPGEIPECNLESNSRADMKLFYQNEGLELFNEDWKFENCVHGDVKKHPTDCTKYFTCSFGVYLQEQSCATGLHFNEKRSACDWPESAECKPSIMDYAESYYLNNPQNQAASITNKTETKYKIICYLTNWSAYRYNNLLFPVKALDSHLCTHLIYGFVTLDPQTLTIKSDDTFTKLDNEFFKRVRVLKESGVKVLLALGAYNRLLDGRTARTQFVKHSVKFLKEHDFDGLEINWEYPNGWQIISDKNSFTTLVRDLKEAFWKSNLLLSVAVSPSSDIIEKTYDVAAIISYVDWISIMAFDYHGYWEGKTDHIAPLISTSKNNSDNMNVDSSVSYWLEKGVPNNKIILGLPFYGQSFRLKNLTSNKIGSKVIGPGMPGRHTRVPGFMAFYEICEMVLQGNWKTVKEKNGHYAYKEDQWINYNDVLDIRNKGKYIKENDIGGALIWSLDLDDFVNVCGCGAYPLLTAINDELSPSSYRNQNRAADCTK